jgi:hypothetical protein
VGIKTTGFEVWRPSHFLSWEGQVKNLRELKDFLKGFPKWSVFTLIDEFAGEGNRVFGFWDFARVAVQSNEAAAPFPTTVTSKRLLPELLHYNTCTKIIKGRL